MADPLSEEEFDRKLMHCLAAGEKDEPLLEAEELEGVGEDDAADLLGMQEALGTYRTHLLNWSEERSATLPSPLAPGARRTPAWLQSPQWVLGTVAFCVCVVGGALYTHHQNTLLEQAALALPDAPTQQALTADNQLLSSVDDALRGSAAPGEQELGLTDDSLTNRAQTRHPDASRTN